ncbi:MAG: hypothetical protein R2853_08385 [Thermomicrobiales bacterium]
MPTTRFPARLGNGLAGTAAFEQRELLGALADAVGDALHHPPTLIGAQARPRPLIEGSPRRGDRALDISEPRPGDLGQRLIGGRIEHRECLSREGRHELIGQEYLAAQNLVCGNHEYLS